MGLAKNRIAYLVGGMESAPMMGAGWRRDITPFLQDLGFGVIDPVLKEANIQIDDKEQNWYQCKKSKKNFPIFLKNMRKIIDLDLDIVENYASHLVIFWDKYAAQGAGSQGEITLGYKLWKERKRPELYMVVDGMAIHEVPGWLLGCSTAVFPSVRALKTFMKKKFGTTMRKPRRKKSVKASSARKYAKVIPIKRAKKKKKKRKGRKK